MDRKVTRRGWWRRAIRIRAFKRAMWTPLAIPSSGISPSAIKKWKLLSPALKDAFLRADGFDWEAFPQAPGKWATHCGARIWKLKAPAYGLNDALAAFYRSLKRRGSTSDAPKKCLGLRCQVSPFDPCLFFIFRGTAHAVYHSS